MSQAQTQVEVKVPFLKVDQVETKITFAVNDVAQGFAQVLTIEPSSFSDDIKLKAMFHGFNQKVRDAAAGFSGNSKKGIPSDGKGAIAAMQLVIDSLVAGEWNRKGGGQDSASIIKPKLAAALAKMQKVTEEQAMKVIDSREEEVWRKWWTAPKTQEVWKHIELERAKLKTKDAKDDKSLDDLAAAFATE